MKSQTNYFLQTLEHLRNYEEVMLYGNLLEITNEQAAEAVIYLQREFEHEKLTHQCKAIPVFDSKAALWAARTIYTSAQLMLYREHKEIELELLFAPYHLPMTASAQLSADLMLRFLPDIITHLKMISPEDALVPLLEKHITQWRY